MKKQFGKALLMMSFLVLSGATVYAQCEVKVDDMTNEKSISSKYQRIGSTVTKGMSAPMYLKASISSRSTGEKLILWTESLDINMLDHVTEVLIKFDDESVIKIPAERLGDITHYSGEPFTQGTNTTIWSGNMYMSLTDDIKKAFKEKKITKIRCGDDYVVKGKGQTLLAEALKCIEEKSK